MLTPVPLDLEKACQTIALQHAGAGSVNDVRMWLVAAGVDGRSRDQVGTEVHLPLSRLQIHLSVSVWMDLFSHSSIVLPRL